MCQGDVPWVRRDTCEPTGQQTSSFEFTRSCSPSIFTVKSLTPVKSTQLVGSCLSIPSRLAFAVGAMALRNGFGQPASGSLSFVKTSGQQTDSQQYTSNRKRGWRALHHTSLVAWAVWTITGAEKVRHESNSRQSSKLYLRRMHR